MSRPRARPTAPGAWTPPGRRREVVLAALTAAAVVLGTAGVIWGMHAAWDDDGGTVVPPIELPTTLPAPATSPPTTANPAPPTTGGVPAAGQGSAPEAPAGTPDPTGGP